MDKSEYHLESVGQRLYDLFSVLRYDADCERHLTVWQRMAINQERADLLRFKAYLFGELDITEVRFYTISKSLETKVKQLLNNIKQLDYDPTDKY
jgi:hypothetical protein